MKIKNRRYSFLGPNIADDFRFRLEMAEMFNILKRYEKIIIQALMVMMAIVLGLATLDLGWLIVQDIVKSPLFLLSVNQLLEIFGLFMLVVIGIELLESIMKAYITQGRPHFEVVISVAIIAIARKVIILDVKEMDDMSLLGIAAIFVALTIGYFVMKKAQLLEKKE
jgi:uncharacterized membrane protein (DUF373 family)